MLKEGRGIYDQVMIFWFMIANFVLAWFQERIPIEEVFQQLRCTREGLSSEEGEERSKLFGLNKLEEKSVTSENALPPSHDFQLFWISARIWAVTTSSHMNLSGSFLEESFWVVTVRFFLLQYFFFGSVGFDIPIHDLLPRIEADVQNWEKKRKTWESLSSLRRMLFLCSHALVSSWVQESKFLKFLGFMWNPLSWVMEAAAIMAIIMTNGGVKYHPLLWEQTDNLWVAVARLKMWSILASVICGIVSLSSEFT